MAEVVRASGLKCPDYVYLSGCAWGCAYYVGCYEVCFGLRSQCNSVFFRRWRLALEDSSRRSNSLATALEH